MLIGEVEGLSGIVLAKVDSGGHGGCHSHFDSAPIIDAELRHLVAVVHGGAWWKEADRKSTRLNSSHRCISYAVFCLKKKKQKEKKIHTPQHYVNYSHTN